MATILVSDTNLTNIANAIRTKNGSANTYKVNEMASAINNLPEAGSGDSSGSVETCTVEFANYWMLLGTGWTHNHLVTYTKLVDGQVTTVSENYGLEFTLSDVVVGSTITLINIGNLEGTKKYTYYLSGNNSHSNIIYDGGADIYTMVVEITGDEVFDFGGRIGIS